MKYIEITDKTIEEALKKGNAEIEKMNVQFERSEVIQNPSSGFLGFGKKDCIIRFYYEGEPCEEYKKSQEQNLDTHKEVEEESEIELKAKEYIEKSKAIVEEAVEEKVEAGLNTVETMTEKIIETGKNIMDEAVEKTVEIAEDVSNSLNTTIEEVKESVSKESLSKEDAARIGEKGKTFLAELLSNMNYQVMIEKMITPERVILHVHTTNDEELGLLIGKRGQTLDSIQYLVNLVANKDEAVHSYIMVDVENYRARREETLKQLAKRQSEKVKNTGRRVSLEPMSAYERKIIHTALQEVEGIVTFSEGEGKHRHIVIQNAK